MLTRINRNSLALPRPLARACGIATLACAMAWPAHGEFGTASPPPSAAPFAAGVGLAQRVTKPGEPAPPAPPPPPVQPRTGVSEPPKPGTAEPPATAAPGEKTRTTPAAPFEPVRVTFDANSASLTDDTRATLDKLAATLRSNATVRVMVKAYTGGGASVSETRRLSLQRGTAVRNYLIEKGFSAKRIDLQPLGSIPDDGPRDRVDVMAGR